MKKTMVSLAAASLIATTAMAADKGIDIVTTGQAVVYYETNDANGQAVKTDLFDQGNSVANVGVQLNLGADLGNNFTFGSQLSYLGTAGLEKNLVGATKQTAGALYQTTDELALTKIFVAKKIANTTVKIGRQELPKSLSPLAFSEGWNVFKNTFEAILVVNSDIPNTTLVGAYVGKGSGMNLGAMGDPAVVTDLGGTTVAGSAYMITAANKSIPMTAITASYYHLSDVGNTVTNTAATINTDTGISADALWLDVAVAGKDLPMGLKIGVQAGVIMPDNMSLGHNSTAINNATGAVAALPASTPVNFADTTALGLKASIKPIDKLTVCLAYTSVDGDNNKVNVAVKNTGTGIKTPLYTQMVYNQNAIALDADTFMIKGVYNTGDYGKVVLQYGSTSAGQSNLMNGATLGADYQETDLLYIVKAGGVKYFTGLIHRTIDTGGAMNAATGADKDLRLRIWARYAF